MLVFLALVLGWTVRDYEQLMHQEKRLASGAMDAYIKLLQARRHEKDFLLRLDDTYVDKQTKAVAELRSTVQELAGLPLQDAVLQPVEKEATAMSVGAIFAALAPEIDAYQTSFTAMVEANRKRGLTAEAGAQKVFREAAHFLEKSLSPDDDRIMVLLLQVRRSEKDYMLRLRSEGEKYRSRTLADLDRLETAAGALPGNGARRLSRPARITGRDSSIWSPAMARSPPPRRRCARRSTRSRAMSTCCTREPRSSPASAPPRRRRMPPTGVWLR